MEFNFCPHGLPLSLLFLSLQKNKSTLIYRNKEQQLVNKEIREDQLFHSQSLI